MSASGSTAGARTTLRSPLASVRFRRLVVAHGAATVAQLLLTLAVGLEVLARTGSGTWVSLSVAAGFAPYAVLSGYAGAIADRHPRGAVLAWSAGLRTALALPLLAGLTLDAHVGVLVGLSALAAVVATPAFPAVAAATPQCVPDAHLTAANALVTGVENLAWMAGPGALGLLVLAGAGPAGAVSAAAALLLLACLVAATVRLEPPVEQRADRGWRDLAAGVEVLRDHDAARLPLLVAVVDNFLYGYLVVAAALLAGGAAGGEETFGWLGIALTIGAAAAVPAAHRVCGRRPRRSLLATTAGFCAVTALLGATGTTVVGPAVIAAAGAASLLTEVVAVTMLQRAAPAGSVARLFGVYDQLAVAALTLGSFAAGPLAAAAGPGLATIAVAAACLALTAAAAAVPEPRTLPEPPLRAEPEVLRGLPAA